MDSSRVATGERCFKDTKGKRAPVYIANSDSECLFTFSENAMEALLSSSGNAIFGLGRRRHRTNILVRANKEFMQGMTFAF